MSWQLASFTILGLALVGGFGWYERTKPDARVVALVGTLAAFAALGRIAFAAVPNVKPTTDIILIAGFALGGAPGFVVGAVAGLTSNFFFGQGPWTPWQMTAWGVCGLIGAGLGRVNRRTPGRWQLAIVCGLVGYAFTAFQDFGSWVTYSDHSAAQLGIYVGKGTGFDLISAAGCVFFALLFGPSLARSLGRFSRRLQVTWIPAQPPPGRPLVPMLLIAAVCGAGALGGALAAGLGHPGPARAAESPVGYLLAAQNPDGGLGGGPGQGSSTLFSGWAALGLAAAEVSPADVTRDGHSLLGYVEATAGAAHDPGSLERTLLIARAAGISARDFGGVDLLAALRRDIRPDGSVSHLVDLTAFAVLALRAAGAPIPLRSIRWLIRQEDRDGGFNYATAGGQSDVDDTGTALEALGGIPAATAPGLRRVRARAVAFIRAQQNRDGGFPSMPGATSNAQSTAFAVQGLDAVGLALSSVNRALAYLRSLIAADGHVAYAPGSDQTPVWVTAEAELALAGRPFPLASVAPAPAPRARLRRRVPGQPTGPATARPAHRRASRRHRTARMLHRPAAPASAPAWLTTDAGALTALLLAPLGG